VTDRTAAARTAMVAVLLAVAVAGLQAQGAFSHQGSSALANAGGRVISSAFGVAEGAGLVACVVVLALILPGLRRHKREAEAEERRPPPVPWWAKPVMVLFALAMLAAPWIILLAGRHRKTSATPLTPSHPLVPRPETGHLAGASGSGSTWPLLAGMLLAVAAVIVLAVLARRRRRRDHGPTVNRAARADTLSAGLITGHDVLLAGREPREAIIACYTAMERGFATAGSAPEAPTPRPRC